MTTRKHIFYRIIFANFGALCCSVMAALLQSYITHLNVNITREIQITV